MKIGYARVSTVNQDLETQIQQLRNENCDKIYFEKVTGTKREREEFEKALAELKSGDTLVVTKVDRFARNTQNAIDVVQELFERGVKVHILNMGIIENTPTGKLIFSIFSAFAQFERDMIVERTSEGKVIARQKEDYREGRPKKYTKAFLEHAMELLETNSYKQVENMTGISKSTLIREKRKKNAKI